MWKEEVVCRSVMLAGTPELIDSLGGNAERLFREAGLKITDIKSKDTYIPWVAYARLLENAARDLNAPDFGLRWPAFHKTGLNNFGPIIALLVSSPDVRSFGDSWMRYDRIHTTGSYSTVVEDKVAGTMRIVVAFSAASHDVRQMKEAVISFFYLLRQDFFGSADYAPLRVGFPHRPMSSMDVYKKHFDCPIEFNAESTFIEFPIELLDKKLGPTFKMGRKLFDKHLDARLKKSPQNNLSMAAHIAMVLPSLLGLKQSGAADVANALGMNVRKMQRLLKDEGERYSDVLDSVRESMACQFLSQSDISVARISVILDYSSPAAFRTAFKRWTSMSPREYRKSF